MKKPLFSITLIFIASLFSILDSKAATFTVANTSDDGAGSLRAAVAQANSTVEEDTIVFDAQIFSAPKTIFLTGGQISLLNTLTINGPGASLLTISGNNQSRIFFNNHSGVPSNINNMTLTEGKAQNGGAIYANSNALRLSNLVITGNTATGSEKDSSDIIASFGGGIYSQGELVITDSIISNNTASGVVVPASPDSRFGGYGTEGGGGGIYSRSFNTIIINCAFVNNAARGGTSPAAEEFKIGRSGGYAYGGALYGIFAFRVYNSTFTNNSAVAGNGGAIPSYQFTLGGDGGEAYGGAINTSGSGSVILNSVFNNNKAVGGNGGVAGGNANNTGNGGKATGGAFISYDVKMANTTVVDNQAVAGNGRAGGNSYAGGISGNSNYWNIVNSTITGNSVSGGVGTQSNGVREGGGIIAASSSDTQQTGSFSNNIVAENSADTGADVLGNFFNAFNNLIGKGEGGNGLTNGVNGNLLGVNNSPLNPRLAPLADNGGMTQTRALLPDSPAVNAGSNARAINPVNSQNLQFDQRGFQRIAPAGGTVDIGAYELGASGVPASAAPDLRDASDTGISPNDNITKATQPLFEVLNVIPGAKVDLLRNNVVVASEVATTFSIFLTDKNAPTDAVVQYTVRQTIGGAASQPSSQLTVTFDNTAPSVTINQSADQRDPAVNLPIRFTSVFSEHVFDLTQQDISLAGSTADVSNAFINISSTDYTTYTLEIIGVRSPGLVVASILPRATYDAAINYSAASTSTDNSVDFQPNAIAVSVSGRIIRNSGLIRASATVTFTDLYTGEVWTARTNPFGYYRFAGLKIYQQIGSRFRVTVRNKSFDYTFPQLITITGNRSNLNFVIQ